MFLEKCWRLGALFTEIGNRRPFFSGREEFGVEFIESGEPWRRLLTPGSAAPGQGLGWRQIRSGEQPGSG